MIVISNRCQSYEHFTELPCCLSNHLTVLQVVESLVEELGWSKTPFLWVGSCMIGLSHMTRSCDWFQSHDLVMWLVSVTYDCITRSKGELWTYSSPSHSFRCGLGRTRGTSSHQELGALSWISPTSLENDCQGTTSSRHSSKTAKELSLTGGPHPPNPLVWVESAGVLKCWSSLLPWSV